MNLRESLKRSSNYSRRGLLGRILRANLVIAGVSVFSLTGLFLISYLTEFEREQLSRARMLAQFVARQSELPALIGDRGGIEKIAASALGSEDVLAVRIAFRGSSSEVQVGPADADPDKGAGNSNHWSVTGKSWVEAAEDIRPLQSGLLDWEDSLSRRPESLGRVRLRISLQKERTLFRRIVQQSLAVMAGLLSLIVAVQFFRMRNLLRPLKSLVAFTRRVGTGNLLERSPVDQVDEIADVAVAFNHMLDRLGRTTVSRDYVDNIIRSMVECLVVVGMDGRIRTVNEATLALLGYAEADLIGRHFSIIEGKEEDIAPMKAISTVERSWRTQDGRFIPVLYSSAALRATGFGGGDDAEAGFVWLAQNITEQKRVREELIAARERYALAVAGANDGIWDWNVLTGDVYYSPRWQSMLGYEDVELSGRFDVWLGLMHPDDRPRVERELEAHCIGACSMFESEHRMRHFGGTYRWMLSRGLAVRGLDGGATRMAGSQTDITQNKTADPLTALPNRVLFTERLERAFENRRRNLGHRFTVMFLDLDRFKIINDSLGHLAGDDVLIEIARRLMEAVSAEAGRAEFTIARISGDEFAVLVEDLPGESSAAAASRTGVRLISDLEKPFLIGGREVFTSVSIGVVPDTGGYQNPGEILRDADTAMYRAKKLGGSRCQIFDAEMRAQAVMRLELDTDLRKAVERHEFVVYYQPMVSIPGEKLEGFEALVRWPHPERGLIPPAEFIPIAEENGLIVPIGIMVLREACRQMREWQIQYSGQSGVILSVNISPRQFVEPGLPGLVAEILAETGLSPKTLFLEVTETVLVGDAENAIDTMNQLKKLGVGLKIDDFGTGYSSLSYLHRFPFDTIKIDRSFITNLESVEGATIVRAIIALANNLGMEVIAEGAETSNQVNILERLGCTHGQGYYFSRPQPPGVAGVLLATAPGRFANGLIALNAEIAARNDSQHNTVSSGAGQSSEELYRLVRAE
jgi:diguanylate cyclase (GGDEF)-like protein/PAS domain S-box-containing protein